MYVEGGPSQDRMVVMASTDMRGQTPGDAVDVNKRTGSWRPRGGPSSYTALHMRTHRKKDGWDSACSSCQSGCKSACKEGRKCYICSSAKGWLDGMTDSDQTGASSRSNQLWTRTLHQ